MRYWNTTFQEKREQGKPLSSPTTRKFESFSRGTQELLSSSKLTELQLTQLNTKLKNQQKARIRGGNRTSIQKFGPLTGEDAALLIKERQEKEEVEVERKKIKKIKSIRRKIRKALYDQGVTARKQ